MLPSPISPLLANALADVRVLSERRAWTPPVEATIAEAQRLIELVLPLARPPDVLVEPHGAISLEWEVGARGWLKLTVEGMGQIEHAAVIEGDEYTRVETFEEDRLPPWAGEVLKRLLA